MGTWGPHSFDNDAAFDGAGRYREAGLPMAAEQVLLDLRNAIGGLASDIAMLKLKIAENFARLTRKIEKISK